MRYYKVVITDATTGNVFRTYSSLKSDGTSDPGALDIEIDAPVTTFADPMGDTGAAIRLWGIAQQDRDGSADFNGKMLQLYGGMAKGLPLANPAQAGLLLQGQIFLAYGNWLGTAQTLDLIVIANTGRAAAPANIVFNWQAGTPLAQAIGNTLSVAFPSLKQNGPFQINGGLVVNHNVVHVCETMAQFSRFIKELSAEIVNGPAGGAYSGVNILLKDGSFSVYDGTSPSTPTPVSFLDLVGQPTWINPFQIQMITVMRADLAVGQYVTLPRGPVQTQPQGLSYFKTKASFQGTFQIDKIRHAGHLRQPDATSWVSVFNMHLVPPNGS